MHEDLVRDFWCAMATNDFDHASRWLHPDFEYYMPQTGEYLRGPSTFATLNAAYPTDGVWTFEVRTIVAKADQAVSDVHVSDDNVSARAITFHTIKDGLILQQIEYWPDAYDPPAWRKGLVEMRRDFPRSSSDGPSSTS